MSECCVVVADGARARLFALQEVELGEIGPNLVELSDLSNPECEAAGKEIWSDTQSGRNRSQAGTHAYDDHRDSHRAELARRFASKIAEATTQLVHAQQARRLVVVAESRMLGHLRQAMPVSNGRPLVVVELAKDLSKLPAQELHSHLTKAAILPARALNL